MTRITPLFATACAMGLSHALALSLVSSWQLLPHVVYLLGSLTSMWNHGVHHAAARWTDRAVMTVGLGVDAWLVWRLWRLVSVCKAVAVGALILGAVLCYVCAKKTQSTQPHALAHAWVTAAHVLLLWWFS